MPYLSINDLKGEFYSAFLISEEGFSRVIGFLDGNGDNLIHDSEIFEAYGVQQDCKEIMAQLGMGAFSELQPKQIYFGECPISTSPGYSDPALSQMDQCSTNDSDIDRSDAQLALDLYVSLGLYFRGNRDLIQEGETSLLNPSCISVSTVPPVRGEVAFLDDGVESHVAEGAFTETERTVYSSLDLSSVMVRSDVWVDEDIERIIDNLPNDLFSDQNKDLLRSQYADGFLDRGIMQDIAAIDFSNVDDAVTAFNEVMRSYDSDLRFFNFPDFPDLAADYSFGTIVVTDPDMYDETDARVP